MKPLIGVTTVQGWENNRIYVKATRFYARAVELAGGLPVYIPTTKPADAAGLVRRLDGVILSGGNSDVSPHLYGETPIKGFSQLDPHRDHFEIELVHEAMGQDKPLMGICRGCQVLNVALGGTLYQSVRDQIPATGEHLPAHTEMPHPFHSVEIKPETRMARIFGESPIMTNSFHNQSVNELGEGLEATAWSNGGVIEAIEYRGGEKVFAVQWHPEAMVEEYEEFRALFRLVD